MNTSNFKQGLLTFAKANWKYIVGLALLLWGRQEYQQWKQMANAQARLIANQELEKQAVVHKKELDKEKAARKKERLVWIVGAGIGGYLLVR